MFKNFKLSKINLFKVLTYFMILFLLVISFKYYIDTTYLNTINEFYTCFNNKDFNSAKETINNNKLINIFKREDKNNDLTAYFTSVINTICTNLKSNTIDNSEALLFLNEINTYKILNSSLDKLILSLDENYYPTTEYNCYNFLYLAKDEYNNNNISEALNILSKINTTDDELLSEINSLTSNCKETYKENIFSEADELCSNEYFTMAINLLSNIDTSILNPNDEDIINKINEIDDARTDYLASLTYENDAAASSLITSNINYSNINTLNISSETDNLIHVDLNNQLVSIYSGYINNWDLVNEYSCSTGIVGEETPKGIFTITNRGEWFYSEEYEQGGKYWVQFLGDYLFHSLPYDETETEILDYTLGTPASHGCVRLKTDDAKWIYDNISNGTKVIIN